MYELEIKRQPGKFIDKRTPKERIKIAKALSKLRENPYRKDLDIKKLKGIENDYRLRIGKYRFLYSIIKNRLLIYMYKADTRGDIYK